MRNSTIKIIPPTPASIDGGEAVTSLTGAHIHVERGSREGGVLKSLLVKIDDQFMRAADLREAAALFNKLAKALDGQPE